MDKKRPESITVALMNGEEQVDTLTLSSDNEWKGAFTDLPVYAAGQKITYTVKEFKVEGYITLITGDMDDGFTITNNLPRLVLDKEITSEPVNYDVDREMKVYVENDIITFKVTVTNGGAVDLYDVTITDYDLPGVELCEKQDFEYTGSLEDGVNVGFLEVDASKYILLQYKVQASDIGEDGTGKVTNSAVSAGKTAPDLDEPDVPSNEDTVEAPTGEPHISITKDTVSTPANGRAYMEGETISYEIVVTNDGPITVNDIVVEDDMPDIVLDDGSFEVGTLEPGESYTIHAHHIVTAADVDAGWVYNGVVVNGDIPTNNPEEPTDPVGPDEDDTQDPTGTPAEVVLTVNKALTGDEPDTAEEFIFDLTADEEAPLPEQTSVSVNGAGTVSFDKITYYDPGVYTYRVTERDTAAEGYTYDKTVYTVTVTVSEPIDSYNLVAEVEVTAAGQAMENITFTNRYDELISITVRKVWRDNNNEAKARPARVTVRLYNDDGYVGKVELNQDNKWQYTFENLPKVMANGAEYTYYIREAAVSSYQATYDDAENGTFLTVTNTYLTPFDDEIVPLAAGINMNEGDCFN